MRDVDRKHCVNRSYRPAATVTLRAARQLIWIKFGERAGARLRGILGRLANPTMRQDKLTTKEHPNTRPAPRARSRATRPNTCSPCLRRRIAS